VKSLDTFDFTAIPSLNKMLVLELGLFECPCAPRIVHEFHEIRLRRAAQKFWPPTAHPSR
jgi:hypothetical protein